MRLVLAALVIMGSPGPSTVSLAAVGVAFRFRAGIPYALGLITGTIAVLGLVAAGLIAAIFAIPHGERFFRTASALYLLYLAVRIAIAPLPQEIPNKASPSFFAGLLLAVANPKAYIAIGSIFVGSRIIDTDPTADLFARLAILAAIIVVIHLFWLGAASRMSVLLREPTRWRVFNITMAMALVNMGVLPAVQ